jgi:hypothetical protein
MEGHFSTGQSPQRAVEPMEKERRRRRIPGFLNYFIKK